MEFATIISVHNNPDLVRDTIDSVRTWVTNKILLVVDAAGWPHYENFTHPDTEVVCGVYHNVYRSPYKNMVIGFQEAYKRWPDVNFYNYIEYDVLFLNDYFKRDLEQHATAAALGFNLRKNQGGDDHWLPKQIFGRDMECDYLLGAITYYSNRCVKEFVESGFLTEILNITADFRGDWFPNFNSFAVEEIIFPSAASLFGTVENLSPLSMGCRYSVRWQPEISPSEITTETSIVHPTKKLSCPIRRHSARYRELLTC